MRLLFLYLLAMLAIVQIGYTQCLSGECENGVGTYQFLDGSVYDGEFKNGLPDGQGVWTYPKGSKVKGLFKKGLPVGENAFRDRPLTKQKTGCVSGNCHNGIGVYLDEEGVRYVGYFKRNKPSGKGICYYPDGTRYDGYWKGGLPNGDGVMYDAAGELYEGEWIDGTYEPNNASPKIIEEHSLVEQPVQRTYAVVIGIANYAQMNVLDYSDDDAYHFFSFLDGKADSDYIRFLVDENATTENIKEAIEDVANRAGKNDRIIIYYSGHGIEQAIIPFESDGKSELVEHQEISEILRHSEAAKTFYVDACNINEPDANIHRKMNFDDLTVFYSSSPGENSLESNELKQGVFSYYLIGGLKGAADGNGDHQVSMTELYNYVFSNVKSYTDSRQYPSMVVGVDAK